MKKTIAIILTALLMMSLLSACNISFGGAGESISISDIKGGNATLTKSDNSEQAAKRGAKLTAGCSLITGAETCVYLNIDKDSIIKMDEHSEISVSEISSDLLKFELVKGSVLINEKGKEGRLQMQAGSTVLLVRGTFFTMKYDVGKIIVDLIEGKIDVKTDSGSVTNVEQGERVTVSEDSEAEVYTLDVSQFDAFTMDSVMEYKDVLSDASLSEWDFSYISDVMSDSGVMGEDAVYDGDVNYDDSGFYYGEDGFMGDDGVVYYD